MPWVLFLLLKWVSIVFWPCNVFLTSVDDLLLVLLWHRATPSLPHINAQFGEDTPMAGADAPIAGMARFGSEALAAAGTSNLKLPRVYRVSGGELDLDAARIGATVGDMKACLSQVYEIPVYLQRILSGGMELSECMSLAELVGSGCESLLLVLNLDLPRFMDRARDDFVTAASLGRMNTVRSFLEAGMPDNTLVRDQRRLSVLMVACMHGQASVAELFSKWMLR